jgi:hypothetical protein
MPVPRPCTPDTLKSSTYLTRADRRWYRCSPCRVPSQAQHAAEFTLVKPTSICKDGKSYRYAASGSLRLLLLDELTLDHDLDLFTDDPPAIEHHVEGHAEVFSVDLTLGTIGDTVAHHVRVVEFPVLHHG